MFTESAIERYRFSCPRCDTHWAEDYHVRYVSDLEGETLCFYGHGGFPCEAPAAADIVCRLCHCGPVSAVLIGRRGLPLVEAPGGYATSLPLDAGGRPGRE